MGKAVKHTVLFLFLCLKYLKESFHKYVSNQRRDEGRVDEAPFGQWTLRVGRDLTLHVHQTVDL